MMAELPEVKLFGKWPCEDVQVKIKDHCCSGGEIYILRCRCLTCRSKTISP